MGQYVSPAFPFFRDTVIVMRFSGRVIGGHRVGNWCIIVVLVHDSPSTHFHVALFLPGVLGPSGTYLSGFFKVSSKPHDSGSRAFAVEEAHQCGDPPHQMPPARAGAPSAMRLSSLCPLCLRGENAEKILTTKAQRAQRRQRPSAGPGLPHPLHHPPHPQQGSPKTDSTFPSRRQSTRAPAGRQGASSRLPADMRGQTEDYRTGPSRNVPRKSYDNNQRLY